MATIQQLSELFGTMKDSRDAQSIVYSGYCRLIEYHRRDSVDQACNVSVDQACNVSVVIDILLG